MPKLSTSDRGVSLAPTLNAAQAAAALQEVANTGPMMLEAVGAACARQADGLVRTRNGTLYATGAFATAAGPAPVVAAGSTVDIFNVPVGQAGSGFAALTKAETNMTQAGQLVSEAFNIKYLGVDIAWAGAQQNDPMNAAQQVIQQFWEQTVLEFHLGGQDVQTLGLCADWPGIGPQSLTQSATVGAGTEPTAGAIGFFHGAVDDCRDYNLYIPTNTPFKVNLRIPNGITTGLATPGVGQVNVRVSMYGTSITAIQA